MKKWISSIIIGLIIIIAILFNLPFEITRGGDIKWGNQLITEIENYKDLCFQSLSESKQLDNDKSNSKF